MLIMHKLAQKNLEIPVEIFKEGEFFVAYSPALDVSTSAKSLSKVKQRFDELVNIFLEEEHTHDRLETTLQKLGWQRKDDYLHPPELVEQSILTVQLPS